jgi:phytoene synthase
MAEIGMTSLERMPSETDLADVRHRVQTAGSSFYWAMRLLSRAKSDALFAIYAFCRDVDDIADGNAPSADKRLALAEWRRRIEDLFAGVAADPINRALLPAVTRFGLKRTDFEAVIDGMEMDAAGPMVAPSLETLDLYCDRVASAVGRLCVCVFGEPGANGIAVARHLGRALQLTNILRDVAEDAAIGRLYLPSELLAARGILVTTPRDMIRHPFIDRVVADLGVRATQAFSESEAALAQCDPRAMRPAVVMMRVYHHTLERLRADGWRVRPPATGLKRTAQRAQKLALALYYGLV